MTEREKRCVNAHDRCFGGDDGPCPYCEPVTKPYENEDLMDDRTNLDAWLEKARVAVAGRKKNRKRNAK